MPELPEVETVRRGLQPALEGHRLVRVQLNRPDLRFPLPDGFVQRLTGARIDRLDRRAKYLLGHLDRGDILVMHLGMTGRFEIDGATPGEFARAVDPDPKHAHVVFETEAGACVTYYDPRRFGFMSLIPEMDIDSHPWFAGMGPEPLGPDFTEATLIKAFAGRKQGPKTLLLDQRTVAGLGNIYVCEALHRAGISPLKPAGGIVKKRIGPLVNAIKDVLAEAVEVGGSTLRDFAAADGALGYFQHRFRVYDREGEPCPTPGCGGTIARLVQSGRSTFYCPKCQK
ncbi:bifunctional DNA-formamidopyrimidine glycosylase/DNA-(apurinic or apyrimidinic site) lyase [Caulobacter sp. SLTY]|uniref:bifunctional DNA-formamidopyrimidine glycosylase/DNA-(apurinic or apyrimidinic site) lyase n=1 Tax=Caulobacter sp. SLTY TaxID=2683262 RepID=UPI0014132726|nr:bifunctional DNA-formamidopyrimidine glycosylase/DNA-(apurinic or apyrimidinic site) lyase [Caulobacter sp. SLTY]NBB15089.1 bifunctional DNA-formamidopyrimidine glycosylase/DNA-(apurinic or apyrimidinic site) lyase [Caulobacter sp. SLTY]